jgi:hypothetical protein
MIKQLPPSIHRCSCRRKSQELAVASFRDSLELENLLTYGELEVSCLFIIDQ